MLKNCELAVVVPAFKGRFLSEALRSICEQTEKRFNLYVFDDCSPDEIGEIFDSVASLPNATYFRFEENLGGKSLVAHWNRCVRRTNGEPWVWLFSDDDLADPTCVSGFYSSLAESAKLGADAEPHVYRFNSLLIDEENTVRRVNPPHPARESPVSFAYHRLVGYRLSFAPDHIFRRSQFDRHGGFVDLPFGLGSDDASWITFSGTRSIATVEGPFVSWRLSGLNISGSGSESIAKIVGYFEFAEWMKRRFSEVAVLGDGRPQKLDIGACADAWALGHIQGSRKIFSPAAILRLMREGRRRLGIPGARILFLACGANQRTWARGLKSCLRSLFPSMLGSNVQ